MIKEKDSILSVPLGHKFYHIGLGKSFLLSLQLDCGLSLCFSLDKCGLCLLCISTPTCSDLHIKFPLKALAVLCSLPPLPQGFHSTHHM